MITPRASFVKESGCSKCSALNKNVNSTLCGIKSYIHSSDCSQATEPEEIHQPPVGHALDDEQQKCYDLGNTTEQNLIVLEFFAVGKIDWHFYCLLSRVAVGEWNLVLHQVLPSAFCCTLISKQIAKTTQNQTFCKSKFQI